MSAPNHTPNQSPITRDAVTNGKPNNGFSVDRDLVSRYKSKLKSSHESKDNKSKGASEAGAGFAPCCNTGGRYFKNFSSLSFIDWLRVTTSDGDDFNNFIFEALRLLAGINIDVSRETKGMIGYSIRDSIVYGKGDDAQNIGNIATGNHTNEGGLFELNGEGCSLIKLHYPGAWLKLNALMVEFKLRLTRLDIALDFQSDYAIERGYTVPYLTRMAIQSGLMDKDSLKGEQSLKTNNIGQWGELMCKSITPFSYDPLEHAQSGLTSYFGNRKSSPDFFRIYEKGKQLDSNLPEGDEQRAYFRIEQEMKHDSGKRPIPLDAMLNPDAYFGEGRSGLRDLLDEMLAFYHMDDVDELHRETKKKQASKLLTNKCEWLRETGGRTLATLLDKTDPKDRNKLIAYLTRPEGLKEYVNDLDLKEYNVVDDLLVKSLIPKHHKGKRIGSYKPHSIKKVVQVGALATT